MGLRSSLKQSAAGTVWHAAYGRTGLTRSPPTAAFSSFHCSSFGQPASPGRTRRAPAAWASGGATAFAKASAAAPISKDRLCIRISRFRVQPGFASPTG